MKKFTMAAGITAAVLIGVGFLLVVAGVLTGAERGVYFDKGGIKMIKSGEDFEYEKYDIDNVKEIDIDISNARVEFKASQSNKFGINVSLCDNSETPVVNTDNGKISVSRKAGIQLFRINFDLWNLFSNKTNVITVYIPRNTKFDSVCVDTSNGAIDIQQDFTTDTLEINTSNGRITVNGVTCSKKAELKTSNGGINCNGKFNTDTYFKTSNGRVEAQGSYKGRTYIKTSNGAIEFSTSESEKTYNIDADTSNGSIRLNGIKVDDDYRQRQTDASNTLEIDTSNGSVTMNFGN